MTKIRRTKTSALYIATDGTELALRPKNGKFFTLEELQGLVAHQRDDGFMSCRVQFVPLPSGKIMVCNDDGRLIGCELNIRAMMIWKDEYPPAQYPYNNDGIVVGNVLISPKSLIR